MELRYSARVARDILTHDRSWREHHAARPGLFAEELKKLLSLVSAQPRMGQRCNRFKAARVVVIRETEHLLFYRVHRDHVTLLALVARRTLRRSVGRMD